MRAKTIAISAVAATLTFVVTYVTGFVRTPLPGGYLNIGDSVIFITALLFGPLPAFIAGSVGSALADLAFGSLHFAPGTFFIKGTEGLIVALVYQYFKNRKLVFSSLTILAGVLVIITSSYGIYFIELEDKTSFLIFMFSGIIFSLLGLSNIFSSKFQEELFAVSAMILGGLEMVLGYYLYETIILKYVAIAEVPLNAIQATISLIVALPIFKSLKRTLKV